MPGWDDERALLRAEWVQASDEGRRPDPALLDAIEGLSRGYSPETEEAASKIWSALSNLPPDPGLRAAEPDDLDAIRALRPAGPRSLGWKPSGSELLERMHGAWTGRAVGCALGKPVESPSYGMAVEAGLTVGRSRIRRLLEDQSAWPLRDYFSGQVPSGLPPLRFPGSTRERIAYMEPDDDIHYTLLALGVLEETGPGFTWRDVAWYWTEHLPYSAICTAETQAILNFWSRSTHMARFRRQEEPGVSAAWTRSHRNPYREWIGAQIRSDGWGWACAGRPELAAEFAYRDASWTHVRNGIYGEMMFAAIQAAAFVEDDPRRLVEIGLSEIPAECRLAQWVRRALEWARGSRDFESALDAMEAEETLRRMSPVHTINNAVACVLALLFSGNDLETGVCNAVSAGIDTDCNGATVGSVLGAVQGRAGLGSGMSARLNDTVRPAVLGFEDCRMRDLAERQARVWRRIDDWIGNGAPA